MTINKLIQIIYAGLNVLLQLGGYVHHIDSSCGRYRVTLVLCPISYDAFIMKDNLSITFSRLLDFR